MLAVIICIVVAVSVALPQILRVLFEVHEFTRQYEHWHIEKED